MTVQILPSSTVWRPFTQMKTAPLPLKVVRAEGVFLQLEDGRQLIDCISSWWVNLHGHANPDIAKAIYEQARTLEHVIFAGFTHEPAEELAGKLVDQLPPELTKVFYSDNGSTSVEVALKMAVQYWHNRGYRRTRLLAFEGGYHGDTLGCMSVGGSSPFYSPFESLLCAVDFLPFPHTFDDDGEREKKEAISLEVLTELVKKNRDSYAAIIIEPLVQGAAGMRMCHPEFLPKLKRLARDLDILLIFDEVMTGFGRTGDWFACNKAKATPDIICLSKGISGGFLPLAATVTSDEVFQSFYSDDLSKTFFHGHSYTANPLSCAAGVASWHLLQKDPAQFQDMEAKHRDNFERHLRGLAVLRDVRFCGTIAAFDLTTSAGNNYFDQIGALLKQKFIDSGLLIRPLGNTIYLMPPYCITDEQLESVYARIRIVLDEVFSLSCRK